MTEKTPVGVLGATGMVGQKYLSLLSRHPWFEVAYVAASPTSAGKKYEDAVAGRWQSCDMPENIRGLTVGDANDIASAKGRCAFVFSAVETDKAATALLEEGYAKAEIPVVSNTSAHRDTPDVPVLIPEINYEHLDVIPSQRKRLGTTKGFIVTKPNCSLQSYMLPVYALIDYAYDIRSMVVTTMQAISGAGYPGVPSYDMLGNVVPHINGEEEKSEKEPLKILGRVEGDVIVPYSIKISAHCNRVPVMDGHMACVSLGFKGTNHGSYGWEKMMQKCWSGFSSVPQSYGLPSAPKHPIVYVHEPDRPQPKLDVDRENGMAVTVGRLRKCNVLDIRFVGLSHNTVRGAAGGGILNAELLHCLKYLD